MDLLQQGGHVKVLSPDYRRLSPQTNWQNIGRRHATTFEGFCSQHDSALFAAIDTRSFDPTDDEQLFLYAYRAVARELHTQMQAAVRTQSLYQQRIAAGIDKGNEPEPGGMIAVEQMMAAHSTYVYKCALDSALLKKNFKTLHHEIFRFAGQPAAIAASVFFDIDTRRYRDESPRATLNILPISHDETIAVFSFTKIDANPMREYLSEIITSRGEYQKYLLSRLLLMHAENFVVSPRLFDTWSEEKRNAIRDFFVQTARYNSSDQNPDFYLF